MGKLLIVATIYGCYHALITMEMTNLKQRVAMQAWTAPEICHPFHKLGLQCQARS